MSSGLPKLTIQYLSPPFVCDGHPVGVLRGTILLDEKLVNPIQMCTELVADT